VDPALEKILADIARFRNELRSFSKLFEPLPAPADTHAALASLCMGIASLSSTGLMACSDGEIYAARALARAVAEHHTRFMSIVGGSVPASFFGDLDRAEAVDLDRRMRICLPNGQIPTDIPAPVRAEIQRALIDPEPTPAERRDAREMLQKFRFDPLFEGILTALKAHDGEDDPATYVTMLFAYARFSACIHGGPSGREFIVSQPSTFVVASTAADLIAPWVSSLTLLLAMLRGPGDPEARRAIDLHREFLRWV
jgi:hypothetical protein